MLMPLPRITRHAARLLFAGLAVQPVLAQTVAELRKRCHDGAVAQAQAQTPTLDPRGGTLTGGATTIGGGTQYNPGVGTPLPAMSGSTRYGDVTLISTPNCA